MPIVKIVNMSGNEVGELTLSDKLFGADVNGAVLHAAVIQTCNRKHSVFNKNTCFANRIQFNN